MFTREFPRLKKLFQHEINNSEKQGTRMQDFTSITLVNQ